MRRAYRKYPNFIEAIENRYKMYNDEKLYVRNQEKSGNVLVIRPGEPLNISPLTKDPEELKRVYELGRRAAGKLLEETTWINS